MKNWISVCIVEDLKDIRERVKREIENSEDFVFLAAYEDAETAVAEMPSLVPDIVLMDINLPGMSGIDCIRKIRERSPATQFMMFTIYEDSDRVFDALSAGASGYLLKNTPPGEILDAMKELHEGGAPMSMRIARKVVDVFKKTDPAHDRDNTLSSREKEVLQYLSKGFLYKEIADKTGITTGTVRQHIHNIYEKLHVQNRTEALNKYFGRNPNLTQ
jgi:DNA-binding NarL/FixJ family response regulator